MNDVVILIPAYNPNHRLIDLVKDLELSGFKKILVINDGSLKKYQKVFLELEKKSSCLVLEYSENKGKGYAIKYGINYYLENLKNAYKGIVTVDDDYQHEPDDIKNIALKLLGNQDSLILGVRDFKTKGLPFGNKFGNKLTSLIFRFLYGTKISDTQTGLRGIPNRYLNLCLEASGKRFEYEMNMLISFIKNKKNVLCIPIKTIYHKKNNTMFNNVINGLSIYKALFSEYIKYGLTSLFAAFIDIIIFTAFLSIFNNLNANFIIIMGTFTARIVSAFVNFNLTKYLVFKSHEKSENLLVKFYLHNFINMIASATLVLILHNLFPNVLETIFKVIVDTTIYIVGYKIQKKYIFKV